MLQQRLIQLKNEFEVGSKQLRQFESRAEDLSKTLLRISGAIQVLEELIQKQEKEAVISE